MKTRSSGNLHENPQHEEPDHDVVQLSVQPIAPNSTTSDSKSDSYTPHQEPDDIVITAADPVSEARSITHQSSTESSPEQSGAITITSPPAPFPQKRKLKFRMALLSTGIIAIFVGGAIGGLSIRKVQYDKMAQAQAFFDDACHTETFPNVQALGLAQQNWAQAENLLQTVPPLPGLGVRDAQALRSTFDRCRQNLDATDYFFEAANTSRDARYAVNQLQGLPEESWMAHLRQLDTAIEHL